MKCMKRPMTVILRHEDTTDDRSAAAGGKAGPISNMLANIGKLFAFTSLRWIFSFSKCKQKLSCFNLHMILTIKCMTIA